MCVKWLALGFVKYFTNAWCWLDFVIVMVRNGSNRINNIDCRFTVIPMITDELCINLIDIHMSLNIAVHIPKQMWRESYNVSICRKFNVLLITYKFERWFSERYNFESVNLDVLFKVSLLNLTASWAGLGNVPVFKTMRTLRGLRPLRALSRMQSMKVIITHLINTNHINSSVLSYLTFTNLLKRGL